jgi:hypothetical protein
MVKYDSPKGLENDKTHYEKLGGGLTQFRSGIEHVQKTLSRANERADETVGESLLPVYRKLANNPASDKWIGRHKGDLITLGAILGTSILTAYFAGKAADSVVYNPASEGRHIVYYGEPFVQKEIITVVNSGGSYTFPYYPPGNNGKNEILYGLVSGGGLGSFWGGTKLGKCAIKLVKRFHKSMEDVESET